MIFARQSDMPSTLSNNSPLLGKSDSSHRQMVMRNVSITVLAIAKDADMDGVRLPQSEAVSQGTRSLLIT